MRNLTSGYPLVTLPVAIFELSSPAEPRRQYRPTEKLGRTLGNSIFSLMALTRDPIYQYVSQGCRGQPRKKGTDVSFIAELCGAANEESGKKMSCPKAKASNQKGYVPQVLVSVPSCSNDAEALR